MSKENWAKNIAVIIKGFIAMVMQIIVIRELLIIFSGNELSLGIILSNWLLLEALGSGLLAKIFTKFKHNIKAYTILQIFIILTLPLTIWLIRTAKVNLGIFYGEIVNLPQMFLISFSSLFLFSILDGLQFYFACRMFSQNLEATAITKVYLLEALGMLLGGIIFSYIFLPLFNSFQITFLLGYMAIVGVFYLCLVSTLSQKQIILRLLIFLSCLNVALVLTDKIDLLHQTSLQKQFPKQKILNYQNSIYGNVTVTEVKDQLTFFSNGVPSVVTPITDITFTEEFVHLTLLHHPMPKDILLISAGAGGILNEILKEPLSKVDYAELDPLIIKEIKKFPSELTVKELNDARVNIIYQDGRGFVKNSQKKYDVIFINVASPTTLQTNRMFTQEFYQEAKNILKTDGLISLRLPGSLTYLNEELRQLNSSIYKTLTSVYRYVSVVPGDFNLFLASNNLNLQEISNQVIIQRFKDRNLKTHLLTPFSLSYRLDKSWREWFFEQLKDLKIGKLLNRDFTPRGLFYGLAFLYSLISPQTKNIFRAIDKINLTTAISLIFIIFSLVCFFSRRNSKTVNLNISWLILISGFSGITFELILILGFQIIYGLIYAWIGILSSAFMFGLASGSLILNWRLNKIKNNFVTLLKFEFAIITFSLMLPVLLFILSKINEAALFGLIKMVFCFLSFLAGFLLGAEFPLANKIYFSNPEFRSRAVAQLYAYDLTGACLGAIMSAIIFIPILGMQSTGIFIAFLKLLTVMGVVFSIRKQGI
ncbi:MAG: hypothetical protein Q8O13_00500 [Candidatus Omnitrophota bacterium]|nr:hypothetical protein [Candidatus Omnitrophota bacterium]